MNALCRLAGGVGTTVLGLFLLAASADAGAGHGVVGGNGRPLAPGFGPPGVLSAGRVFNSPPAFIDRGPAISVRPFAQPFIDRSPSIADRPLAPIGGGSASSPDPAPPVWCQGRGIGAERAWRGCPWW
jgi:hypothetical protein